MKKTRITTLLLVLFPLLTVFVASSPDGVMVFDGSSVMYCTWFQPVEQSRLGWCAPVAALLNYLIFGLAIINLVLKKSWALKALTYLSLAAVCIVVLPVVSQGDVKVIPNVLGIILLAAQSATAALLSKTGPESESKIPKGKRLESR